jgi:hypothetical protein
MTMKKILPYLVGTLLAAFGLLTLFLSSSVLFDLFGIREREGNFVPLVVWANFFASLLYLVSSVGFFQRKYWAARLLGIAVLILLLAFVGLLVHIQSGGIYETKTVGALPFRIIVTLAFALFAHFTLKKITK